MDESDQAIVKIGEETFSSVEVPASGTVVVQEHRKLLLGSVDLPTFVADLGRVGKFVRGAYHGVAGYTKLHIKIRDILCDVSKLCDTSAVTVTGFKMASESILGDLKLAYQFLLDDLEEMAIVVLAAMTEQAKDMSAAADKLLKGFDEESKRVEEALKETMTTKGSKEGRKKELEEKVRQLAQERENAEEDFKLYKKRYEAAKPKQEAHESSASNPGERKVFDMERDLERSKEAREEKLKHLERMIQQREILSKAIQNRANWYTKEIENCKDDSELADIAIVALHKAMEGLQNLSAVMMKAALFWKQMQVLFEQLAKKMPEEKRLKTWTSPGFKKQAISYYAQWVALDDICGIYLDQIHETQHDLDGYRRGDPTLAEARRIVRELAATFGEELAIELKAIEKKSFAAQEARDGETAGP